MFINILTIACGLTLGYVLILLMELLLGIAKNLIYSRKTKPKLNKVFNYQNKQFQKIEKENVNKK